MISPAAHATDNQRLLRRWPIIAYDLAIAAVSFPLAFLLRWGDEATAQQRISEYDLFYASAYGVPIFVLICFATFTGFGMYRGFWRYASTADLLPVLKAVTLAILLFVPALYLVEQLGAVARSIPVIQWFILLTLLSGSRLAYAALDARRRASGAAMKAPHWQPVLLVGAGDGAALLVQMLRLQPNGAYEIVGILDDRASVQGRAIHQVPVLGRLGDVEAVVARLSVHGIRPTRLVLTAPNESFAVEGLETLYEAAERRGIEILDLFDLLHLGGEAAMAGPAGRAAPAGEAAAMPPGAATPFLALKRFADIVVASLGLAFLAPLMALAGLAVWASLGSPVIFHQVRPGLGMRAFTLYKFRTMRDAYQPDGRMLSDDERQNLIGRLLRRTRLDELPQLWNVLTGDMALIGPRPLLPRDLPELGDIAHERFSLRPGITGWAQVNGGHSLTAEEKLALDLHYIRHYSLRLEIEIVLKTLWMMAFGERVDPAAVETAMRSARPGRGGSHHSALPT